jgi:hypothetical protein
MRLIRWGIGLTLTGLHLVMNGPVWSLIGRASVFGSSSSDHRYELVDKFITNVGEWWLLGMKSTVHWGWGMQDVSNNYVRIGIDGGLVGLTLFFVTIIFAFKTVGRRLRAARGVPGMQRLLWGLGVSLFANMVAFLGVSYWDQSIVIWYLLLAIIASAGAVSFVPLQSHPPTGMVPEQDASLAADRLALEWGR